MSEQDLIRAAVAGNAQAWDQLIGPIQARLRRMVALRIDPRVRRRIHEDDVIQEACIEAFRRLPRYLEEGNPQPFFLWMRWLTGSKLMELHRFHLGVAARDPRREVTLRRTPLPDASSAALAEQILGHTTSPSAAYAVAERRNAIQELLDSLAPDDREVLVLRHFEELTTAECAAELGISREAASKRYVRALRRLKERIGLLPDLTRESTG